MPGASPSFILRTSKSQPHITRLRGGFTRWLSSFDSTEAGCEAGFIYADSQVKGTQRICFVLPTDDMLELHPRLPIATTDPV